MCVSHLQSQHCAGIPELFEEHMLNGQLEECKDQFAEFTKKRIG